jgi:hypothetical protein
MGNEIAELNDMRDRLINSVREIRPEVSYSEQVPTMRA